MFETEVAFRNRHYAHSRFSRALAQRLSISILLLTVALTTASFAQSNYDGPAELPRMTVPSAMAATPAPGSIIAVNAGGKSTVNSGSTNATSASISPLRKLTFTRCSGDPSTAFRVTSDPVPAVVGIAMKGALRLVISCPRPMISM